MSVPFDKEAQNRGFVENFKIVKFILYEINAMKNYRFCLKKLCSLNFVLLTPFR